MKRKKVFNLVLKEVKEGSIQRSRSNAFQFLGVKYDKARVPYGDEEKKSLVDSLFNSKPVKLMQVWRDRHMFRKNENNTSSSVLNKLKFMQVFFTRSIKTRV